VEVHYEVHLQLTLMRQAVLTWVLVRGKLKIRFHLDLHSFRSSEYTSVVSFSQRVDLDVDTCAYLIVPSFVPERAQRWEIQKADTCACLSQRLGITLILFTPCSLEQLSLRSPY
jgi:hypothetical protein